MLKKLFFLFFVCLLHSQQSNAIGLSNLLTAEITNQTTEESSKTFIIDIHCSNINEIAGVQFELPENINLLDVKEVRTKDLNFEFHHNSKGLILGFSMSGETIPPSPNAMNKNVSNAYGPNITNYEGNIICSIKIEYIPPEGKYEGQIHCPIKSILASPKGERLPFTSIESKISLSKYDNPRQIKVSFYE